MRAISNTELLMISGAGEFTYGELAGAVAGGAVVGGMTGAMIGGVGAGPGAIAGAVTAGAGYTAGKLVESYFGGNSTSSSFSSGNGS